jgi:NAD(P)-dependent dehydrogenase (short-subunit alcohol dehydrogenase family)/uncharacterized OB-fold protein
MSPRFLPPAARSRAALRFTAGAALGRFELQVCANCGTVQYPPREMCHRCLSVELCWREQPGSGELISTTILHYSHDMYFREHLPWRLGLVRLDAGPTAVVHLHAGCARAPVRVRVGARLDKSGQGVLMAFPFDEVANMAEDPQLREMTCDPQFRKVLVTDGGSGVGHAVVRALIDAGAERVWVGYTESWKGSPAFAELESSAPVTLVPLDLTASRSVKELAAAIGGQVDILINTAELHGAHRIEPRMEAARAEVDLNYFGLLRLAQEFGPAMRSRDADGRSGAIAWVNVLSIYALMNFPPQATFSASKAAALSLSQWLRAEMRPSGIRVINVFPGPIEEAGNQTVPPPKLSPGSLANALVQALKEGVEDLYPGEVAQEWLARWLESPKTLERELSL